MDAKAAKALREATGAGMMDAKKALMETGNDFDRAVEYLRKKAWRPRTRSRGGSRRRAPSGRTSTRLQARRRV